MTEIREGDNHLRDYVERVKSEMEAAAEIRERMKELSQEAKGNGYDPRALKAIAKRELEDEKKSESRQALEATCLLYAESLGLNW